MDTLPIPQEIILAQEMPPLWMHEGYFFKKLALLRQLDAY